jgi:hypothetical protein
MKLISLNISIDKIDFISAENISTYELIVVRYFYIN